MKLHLMEPMRDQLIAVISQVLDHFLGLMYDEHPVERLYFGEFGQLLKDGNIIAVNNIFRKFIPDEENARFFQVIILDDSPYPFFERFEAIHQSPVVLADNLSRTSRPQL